MDTIVENALKFLHKNYESAKEYVADSEYYVEYTEEKIYHSMQVVGAMKYIMKHEPTFHNRTQDFIDYARIATILHDVGRFEEIRNLYDNSKKESKKESLWGSKLNHGMYGYNILKNSKQYNDPRIYIPVKHHGNMIEELYEDEEFSSIKDEKLKKEIVEIIFLVRDADKTANMYLMTNRSKNKFEAIFGNRFPKEKNNIKINPKALESFLGFQVIRRENAYNFVTQYLNVLSWVFDINYLPSLDLIIKNNSLMKLVDMIFQDGVNNEVRSLIEKTLTDYIKMRYDEKIRML